MNIDKGGKNKRNLTSGA